MMHFCNYCGKRVLVKKANLTMSKHWRERFSAGKLVEKVCEGSELQIIPGAA